MWIFLISTALSSNMLWVYICTKSLLYLFCYANGMVCGGEGPKHVCGLFLVACLSLKLYPGANKQLGTWFFFSKMGLTEKQKKKIQQKWREGCWSFWDITNNFSFSGSWLLLLLLLFIIYCLLVQTRMLNMLLPSLFIIFPHNSHKLLTVKNANLDQNKQKFLLLPSVGFRWALCWATCVPFCLWSRPCAFREKKNTHRTRFLDIKLSRII